MATKLSDDELVCSKELLMTNEVYMEALVQLLLEKGILTKAELLSKINQDQLDLMKSQSRKWRWNAELDPDNQRLSVDSRGRRMCILR